MTLETHELEKLRLQWHELPGMEGISTKAQRIIEGCHRELTALAIKDRFGRFNYGRVLTKIRDTFLADGVNAGMACYCEVVGINTRQLSLVIKIYERFRGHEELLAQFSPGAQELLAATVGQYEDVFARAVSQAEQGLEVTRGWVDRELHVIEYDADAIEIETAQTLQPEELSDEETEDRGGHESTNGEVQPGALAAVVAAQRIAAAHSVPLAQYRHDMVQQVYRDLQNAKRRLSDGCKGRQLHAGAWYSRFEEGLDAAIQAVEEWMQTEAVVME